MARHHLIQYAAFYVILLACGTVLSFQLATFINMENPQFDQAMSWTTFVIMFTYCLPVLSVNRPLPLLLVDSKKFWFAAWLLDFVLKGMVVGFVILGGFVIFVLARAFDNSLVGTLLLVLLLGCLWLPRFIMDFRTSWLYEGNRVPR